VIFKSTFKRESERCLIVRSSKIKNAIKPIYEYLSSDDLLNRCLGGYTQNSNKSFTHSFDRSLQNRS